MNRLWHVFFIGLSARIILAVYTYSSHTPEQITNFDHIFLAGANPLIIDPGNGASFLLSDLPAYVAYLFLNHFGYSYMFILLFLFKVAPIAGDIITFYSLYSLAVVAIGNNSRVPYLVASTYFLNPYSISASSTIGAYESLMIGTLLLAILFIVRGRFFGAGLLFGFSMFFRYLPILILPILLIYLHKTTGLRTKNGSCFMLGTSLATSILASLYLVSLIPMYLHSPQVFWNWVQYFVGSGQVAGGSPPAWQFKWNLTGFLILSNLWSYASSFVNGKAFLLVYVVFSTVVIKRFGNPLSTVLQYITGVFALYLVLTPLSQYHYFAMILPFLVIETYLYSRVPTYIFHILWAGYMIIDLVIQGTILSYFQESLPQLSSFLLKINWPFYTIAYGSAQSIRDLAVQQAIGAVIGTFLLLVVLKMVPSSIVFRSKLRVLKLADIWYIDLAFAIFFITTIGRIAYPQISGSYLFTGVIVVSGISLVSYLAFSLITSRSNKHHGNDEPMKGASKTNLFLYSCLLIASSGIVAMLRLDNPVFLLLSTIVLIILAIDLRNQPKTIHVLHLAMIFTIIYLAFLGGSSGIPLIGMDAVAAFALGSIILYQLDTFPSWLQIESPANFLGSSNQPMNLEKGTSRIVLILVFVITVIAFVPIWQATRSGQIPDSRFYWYSVSNPVWPTVLSLNAISALFVLMVIICGYLLIHLIKWLTMVNRDENQFLQS